jgi:hypothetical protein
MPRKPKRKLTAAQKAEKRRFREQYMTIFIGGKQKRVRRTPTIDGMDVDEFIRNNADPIWLLQNECWGLLGEYEQRRDAEAHPQDKDIRLQDELADRVAQYAADIDPHDPFTWDPETDDPSEG